MSFRTQSLICVVLWVNEQLLYTNTGQNCQTVNFLSRLKIFNALMVLSHFIGSKPFLGGTSQLNGLQHWSVCFVQNICSVLPWKYNNLCIFIVESCRYDNFKTREDYGTMCILLFQILLQYNLYGCCVFPCGGVKWCHVYAGSNKKKIQKYT
jgi:hypothetical protein